MPLTETCPSPGRFPIWIFAGSLLLACGYLPTLGIPFDFIDDGNLVYPHPQPSFSDHVGLWWEKVQANYEHLGPFRPTLWVHWELAANLFGGDPLVWRIDRLIWCSLSAGMLLWLFRELGMAPGAALMAGALAMWNPYRNEIWTSLTLAEGVAMPYALFALIAARKAASGRYPLPWEIASALAVLIALGCKNTFAALVPAQIILRMWPSGMPLKEAWQRNGWRSLALGATLVMPAAHFVYFKQHWHPGQYETHGPSAAQLGRILSSQKGAMSLDFIAFGIIASLIAIWVARRSHSVPSTPGNAEPQAWSFYRPAIACALLLIVGGACMYLPMNMMSGRYAMPGVWGFDILFAMLLTALTALPLTLCKRIAWVGVGAGLAVVMLANLGRQEKFAARAKMLWAAVHYVEANAPPGARVEWVSGDSLAGELNVEEGIHFQWHLYHRGRGDVRIGLYDLTERPLERVELPPLDREPDYRICGRPGSGTAWDPEQSFATAYWLGRRRYDCYLSRKHPSPFHADGELLDQLKAHILEGLGGDAPR